MIAQRKGNRQLMETPEHLGELLRTSLDSFCWAMEQVPRERWLASPPRHPDQWPAARHAFHLAYYERQLALPSLRQWLGGELGGEAPPSVGLEEDAAVEETVWREGHDVEMLLSTVRAVREEQIALLLRHIPLQALDETREAIWGRVTLRWVVTKTLQHTFEHAHDVLRMALWWDIKR